MLTRNGIAYNLKLSPYEVKVKYDKDSYVKYKLYNLDTKRVWNIPHKELELMLRGNKRYNIKPMFTISDEVA